MINRSPSCKQSRIIKALTLAITLIALVAIVGDSARAQANDAIKHTLRFPSPQTHYVEVETIVQTAGRAQVEMVMAVWTPGSYLVREYARNVEDIAARTPANKPLSIDKTAKNRWRIETQGAATILISYRLYSREMSVRTNWVESEFALINGAATFMAVAGQAAQAHEVKLVLPPGWKTTMTGLPAARAGDHHYFAKDFDTLVDSPIVAGNPAVYEFVVEGTKHFLVNVGEGGIWDGPRSAKDVERIVREHRRMWGFFPYDKYVFLNMITESGGGLEHKNSTVLMTNRWATRTREKYVGWLGLVSHEFFHAWNVKQLRPIELGPFDYENEVYTKSLWVAEGLTDYYDGLALRRAGLTTREEYLEGLSKNIESLQTTPGRLVQPVEMASFDAWIKHYRPDENSPNTAISYYTKGAVVGFLLDAKIRCATGGSKSLDDVMRLAYKRYSGERGFTPEEFRAAAQEVAGVDLGAWFVKALETTEELEYREALDCYGLQFMKPLLPRPGEVEEAWTGLVTKNDNGRLIVTQVRRETPGYAAGLNVDDEIVAIGDYRVRADQWQTRLDQYRPGERVSMLVARRDRLVRLDMTLGKDPPKLWRLDVNLRATAEQKARLKAWLGE